VFHPDITIGTALTLDTGTKLGPYEILAPIGAGGMGEVYKAKDTRLDRMVAVKVLPQHLSSSPDVRQRFEREAKTISQLSHPHICALYDVGREGETEYLVMEYLEGETLSDRLAKGSLPLEQTLRFGQEIAEALDKAHRQGIVHRDLKPGNVMLTKSGVKLLDFGLAKGIAAAQTSPGATSLPTVMGAGTAQNLTQEGTILGTFQYMAPEQLEGREADARSDIFAFGAVLYEMAAGKKAFSGSSQASLISAILRDEPQPLSQVQPTSPAALDRIVRTCLAKDPEERWQSAGDLKRELRWVGGESQSGGSIPSAAAAPASRRKGGGRIAWAVALASAAAAIALAFALSGARSIRPAPIHSFVLPPDKTAFQLTGDESAPPALSPDGEKIVFGASGKLWVQSLSTGSMTALAATEGGLYPFWSPDAKSIGFFAGGKLRRIEAAGGPVQVISDAPTPRGGSWGANDAIVFAPDFRGRLFKVSASGGAAKPATTIDTKHHSTHRWPYFLPDGQRFLYLAANHSFPRSDDSGIYVGSVADDASASVRLIASHGSAEAVPGWILTVQDGNLMATPFDVKRLAVSGSPVRVAGEVNFDSGTWHGVFSVSRTGMLAYQVARQGSGGQLTWLDASGRAISTIGDRAESYSLRVSPDGRRASVMEGDPNNDIWVYELERGVRTRLTTDAQVIPSPLWSPDGSQLMYVAGAAIADNPEYLMTTIPSDGAGEKKVVMRSKERIEPTDWSRDGRHVLMDRGNVGAADIWAVPLAEPGKAFPLVRTPFLDTSGFFSPDGRWVGYVSQQTGRFEVYVTSFPGGSGRLQVSGSGGTHPHWSADGRTLYYVTLDGELTAAPVDGTGARFQVGTPKPMFPVNLFVGPRVASAYAVSADGKRVLVISAGEASVPRVALVANWTSALPR
jgi:eukaryotic-like serine/threonine-protein kinase